MNDNLRSQIYRNLDLKETEELLEIWTTNDHVEWSDQAFEVLEEILRKRIDDLPPQNDSIREVEVEDAEDDNLEAWEAKLLDNENQPEFYDTLEVVDVNNKINKLAKIFIYVTIGLTILDFGSFRSLFQGIFPTLGEIPTLLISVLMTSVAVAINIAIVYFSLKALAQILRILMEMEFNSRGAFKKQ